MKLKKNHNARCNREGSHQNAELEEHLNKEFVFVNGNTCSLSENVSTCDSTETVVSLVNTPVKTCVTTSSSENNTFTSVSFMPVITSIQKLMKP